MLKRTWLTRRPGDRSWAWVFAVAGTLIVLAQLSWRWPGLLEIMPVSPVSVFEHREWWRPWTACLVHADLAHLLSNLFFLVIFGRYVGSYFGAVAFPVLPFLLGGIANLLVLRSYSESTLIMGASGVVNIVGGMWLALFFFISRQYSLRSRLLRGVGVGLLLFAPQEFRPEVAERVHLAGFLIGLTAGGSWFLWNRGRFRAAEVWEEISDENTVDVDSNKNETIH